MHTTQQQTSAKPDFFEEGLTMGSNTHEVIYILATIVA